MSIKILSFGVEAHPATGRSKAFEVVDFTWHDRENGIEHPKAATAIIFEEEGLCAVFDPDDIEVKFQSDFFEPKLRRMLKALRSQ